MKTHYVVNSALTNAAPETLFSGDHLDVDAENQLSRQDSVIPMCLGGKDLILKSYFRGGLPGRFIRKTYFYSGLERTRMWREFSLLMEMRDLGLPVPAPLAARCQLTSPFTYQGNLIIQRIKNSRTLADAVAEEPLAENTWARIGRAVAQFHLHRVCHTDLNASNILLNEEDSIHLIDFDKCSFKGSIPLVHGDWAQHNLRRLQRSLLKNSSQLDQFHFNETHWDALRTGYVKAMLK